MIRITIPGAVPSLKNGKRLGRTWSGKTNTRLSAAATAYKLEFGYHVPAHFKGLAMGSKKQLLRADVRIYAADFRRDADPEILFDCLQACGVISNDRWIRMKFVDATKLDANNPRAEIELRELAPQ